MPDFLVFQLYGQMAAWGDIAVGEYRPSRDYPSKSAIVGLVAAALGIARIDEEKQLALSRELGLGVCVLARGSILRDYHTSQVPPAKKGRRFATRRTELCDIAKNELNTILSQRDYHTDFFYKVALWQNGSDAAFSLEKIRQALTQPLFCLYLGRKSCPLGLPLCPRIATGQTLKSVFDSYDFDTQTAGIVKLSKTHHYYWDDSLAVEHAGMQRTIVRSVRDQVRSRRRWQFAERSECHYLEEVSDVSV
ncbi:MAG: type I-E CRISPR-associated protein Cas5/CasD [Pseudomonadota bacterium]|nr:type I-E CRISPR-associated protein Cas5/CasD [Pseudomonadota bacterium]